MSPLRRHVENPRFGIDGRAPGNIGAAVCARHDKGALGAVRRLSKRRRREQSAHAVLSCDFQRLFTQLRREVDEVVLSNPLVFERRWECYERLGL